MLYFLEEGSIASKEGAESTPYFFEISRLDGVVRRKFLSIFEIGGQEVRKTCDQYRNISLHVFLGECLKGFQDKYEVKQYLALVRSLSAVHRCQHKAYILGSNRDKGLTARLFAEDFLNIFDLGHEMSHACSCKASLNYL